MNSFRNIKTQFLSPIVVILAFLIFFNHLVCTLLYLAPENPATNYYVNYVYAYMNPVFLQRWKLFAPEPQTTSFRIWYRCGLNEKWGEWKDPYHDLIKKHQSFRFGYYGKSLYVLKGIARNLSELYVIKDNQKKLNESIEYLNAKNFTYQMCFLENPNVKNIQFSLVTLRAKNFSARKEPGFYGKVVKFDFLPEVI